MIILALFIKFELLRINENAKQISFHVFLGSTSASDTSIRITIQSITTHLSVFVLKCLCVKVALCRSGFVSKWRCVEVSLCRSAAVSKWLCVEVTLCHVMKCLDTKSRVTKWRKIFSSGNIAYWNQDNLSDLFFYCTKEKTYFILWIVIDFPKYIFLIHVL